MSNPPASAVESSGRELGGHQLVREVGHGAMGEVWLAFDPRLERYAAVKMMRCEIADDPTFIQRFIREARAVAKLSHPHIVQIYNIGEEAGMLFFAMEWVDGQTLGQRIRQSGPMPRREALKLISQSADGLEYACQLGVIHRDIKPGNIMIDSAGRVKITDFGLAKFSGGESGAQMTSIGTPIGSPNYMSPEACRGENLDHRADIYSLGITFYQMLLGELPFTAEGAMSVMYKHVNDPLPEPLSLTALDNGLWMSVLRRMTAKKPLDRFQTYSELREALAYLESPSSSGSLPSVIFSSPGPAVTPSGSSVPPTPSSAGMESVLFSPLQASQNSGTMTALGQTAFATLPPTRKSKTMLVVVILSVVAFLLAISVAVILYMDNMSTSAGSRAGSAVSSANSQPPPTVAIQTGAQPTATTDQSATGAGSPAEQRLSVSPLGASLPFLPKEAATAFHNYDFATLNQVVQSAVNSSSTNVQTKQILQGLLPTLQYLSTFRSEWGALVKQYPRGSQIAHPQYGTIKLLGVGDKMLQFESPTGATVDVPYEEISPPDLFRLTQPFWQGPQFRPKADALLTLYPSVRAQLPPPPNGEPPGGQPGGQQQGGMPPPPR